MMPLFAFLPVHSWIWYKLLVLTSVARLPFPWFPVLSLPMAFGPPPLPLTIQGCLVLLGDCALSPWLPSVLSWNCLSQLECDPTSLSPPPSFKAHLWMHLFWDAFSSLEQTCSKLWTSLLHILPMFPLSLHPTASHYFTFVKNKSWGSESHVVFCKAI